MMRARAGDQGASWPQNLHGAEIDFLVAAMGRRDAVAILGECRRIENYHVEAALFVVVLLEQIEGVCLFEGDVCDLIQFLISASSAHGGGRKIYGFDFFGFARDA